MIEVKEKLEKWLNRIIKVLVGIIGIFIIIMPILLLIQGKEIEVGPFIGIFLFCWLIGGFFLFFAIRSSKPKNTIGKEGEEVELDEELKLDTKLEPKTLVIIVLGLVTLEILRKIIN